MKSYISLILTLLLCLCAGSALADTEGYYSYYIDLSSGGAVITSYTGDETIVTVPDTLGGYPVIEVRFGSFESCHSVSVVELPDSLRTMDGGAFSDCPNLTTVYLPENITKFNNAIGHGRYYVSKDSVTAQSLGAHNDLSNDPSHYAYDPESACVDAQFIDPRWPQHVLAYSRGMLYYCGYLGTDPVLRIPSIADAVCGLLNMGCSNFGKSITRIIVPEGVVRLDAKAFAGFAPLDALELPSTLRSIGPYALACTVPALTIPDGVKELPEYMTGNFKIPGTGFRYITIPKSVTTIHETALIGITEDPYARLFCSRGSSADAYALAHNIPVVYLEDNVYAVYLKPIPSMDVGQTFNWRENFIIMPHEPDFPYTVSVKSANTSIISAEGDVLSYNSAGQVKMIEFTSKELGYRETFDKVNAYEPVQSFSVPEYIFIPFGSRGTISVSDVVPAKKTDPVYLWHRPDNGILGEHTAGIEEYYLEWIEQPGIFPMTVTSKSGIRRAFTLVCYQHVTDVAFSPFEGIMALDMVVAPQISMNVDGNALQNVSAAYTLTSSNTAIAAPTADGKLRLVGPGTATITAKLFNGTTVAQTINVENIHLLRLPEDVRIIEAEAFMGSAADLAAIPDGCRSIGSRAFADCRKLARIEIPASVTEIAEDAFDGCSPALVIAAPAGSAAEVFAAAHGFAQ